MSNELIAKSQTTSLTSMTEVELINVLRNSLYAGAQTDSIKMVLGYCQAAGLDPMQKPVHIVPIWDSKAGAMRDVVMPGIGLYRTQMSRTGECAGVSEPEFGDDKTETIGNVEITYPLWCKVVVKRVLPSGQIADYAATERWKENYAMKGGKEKSVAPNAMWTKRPYAQLAKCAEAQALRKAFPELGAAPTADEMEGKEFDAQIVDVPVRATIEEKKDERPVLTVEGLLKISADKVDADGVITKMGYKSLVQSGEKTAQELIFAMGTSNKYRLTDETIAIIQSWEQKHDNS